MAFKVERIRRDITCQESPFLSLGIWRFNHRNTILGQ